MRGAIFRRQQVTTACTLVQSNVRIGLVGTGIKQMCTTLPTDCTQLLNWAYIMKNCTGNLEYQSIIQH